MAIKTFADGSSYNTSTGAVQNRPGTAWISPGGGSSGGGTSGGGSSPQYQILNTQSMSKYSPNQYTRLPSGAVVLNPGVTPLSGTVKTIGGAQSGSAGSNQTYQILNASAMSQYSPNQYQRNLDGSVTLKPGVVPKEGTVKVVGAPSVTEKPVDKASLIPTKYDSVIDTSPALTVFFSDPEKGNARRELFNQISDPQFANWYLQLSQKAQERIQAGEVINPDIEIDLGMTQKFTEEATKQLDPYFQEEIKGYQQDVNTAIQRLTQDYETAVKQSEDTFKKQLAANAEAEAQAGTVYGSERGVREADTVKAQQQNIDEALLKTQREIQDAQIKGERALGSSFFSPGPVNAYGVGTSGYTSAGSRSLYTPTSGLYGTINKDRTTAIQNRANELEKAYRAQRSLTNSSY